MNGGLKHSIKELLTKDPNKTPVRLSLSLATIDNNRIEFVAKQLEISKQQLIEKLLLGALFDLEIELDLREIRHLGDVDYTTLAKEYREAVTIAEVEDVDDDDLPF